MDGRFRVAEIARRAMCVLCSLALALMLVPAVALTQAGDEAAEAASASKVVKSWEIGSPTASDVVATLYGDGTLKIKGSGDCKKYEYTTGSWTPPWTEDAYREKVKKVEFGSGVAPTSICQWFYGCSNLTKVNKIPSSVTDMSSTFAYCDSLKTSPMLPSSLWDMSSTFDFCSSLTTAPSIPSGVTSMNWTFCGCESLKSCPEIPSGVTGMVATFIGCTSLTEACVIPTGVENCNGVFSCCPNLTTLPSGFKIPAAEAGQYEGEEDGWNIDGMFDFLTMGLDVTPAIPTKTYVSKNADESVLSYDWAGDGRELVVGGTPSKVKISKAKVAKIAKQYCTGSELKPAVKVTYGGKTLVKGGDYGVTYSNNVKAGTATATIKGYGNFGGTRKVTFKIANGTKKQTIKVATTSKTIKLVTGDLENQRQSFSLGVKAKGTVSCKLLSVKKDGKAFSNSDGGLGVWTNGTVYVRQYYSSITKGTYKLKVKITASATAKYKLASVTKTITVKVK